jgi:hypothetical protein
MKVKQSINILKDSKNKCLKHIYNQCIENEDGSIKNLFKIKQKKNKNEYDPKYIVLLTMNKLKEKYKYKFKLIIERKT